tara:strand:- start:131 stop:286 length:156 start_codon:yes stop_codon:yes gene_type:complete
VEVDCGPWAKRVRGKEQQSNNPTPPNNEAATAFAGIKAAAKAAKKRKLGEM